MKNLSIVVGTNSLANTQYESYTNHIQRWFNFGRDYPHIKFGLVNPARMTIDRMRNLTAETALNFGADYFLFVDDDVLFQSEDLKKLLACEADVAAAKVPIRGYPFDWMVFKKKGKQGGLFACKELPARGVIPVDAVGFSFCLIKTSILRDIPKPYFVTGVNNTEDIYFCVKARQVDPKCKIVCECSIDAGHILWPEVMNAGNRAAYKKYYESINPHIKEQLREVRQAKRDRGETYLKRVKESAA